MSSILFVLLWHDCDVVDEDFELIVIEVFDQLVIVVFELLQAVVVIQQFINWAVFAAQKIFDRCAWLAPVVSPEVATQKASEIQHIGYLIIECLNLILTIKYMNFFLNHLT